MKREFEIDREFAKMSIPATEEEQAALESSILRNGCMEPISVWNGVIIDGHKRYAFCTFEGMEYQIQEMEFRSRAEAIRWLCVERFQQTARNSMMQKYIVGKRYLCEKELAKEREKVNAFNKYKKNKQFPDDYLRPITIMEVSKEYGMGRNTILDYGKIASSLDAIEAYEPDLFHALITDEIHIKRDQLFALGTESKKGIRAAARKLLKGKKETMMKSHARMNQEQKEARRAAIEETPLSVGIKEMPTYDPDAEARGLMLTISTWSSAMSRALGKIQISTTTEQTRERLARSMRQLAEQIRMALEVVEG